MKDPAKQLMRELRNELDEVLGEMKEYDDAYRARQERKKEKDEQHGQHRR